MFKKSIALISAVSMLLSFAACGEDKDQETTTEKGKDVVATDVITNEDGETEIVTVEKEEDTENEEDTGVENSESKEDNTTEDDKGDTTKSSEDETTKKSDAEKTTKKSNDKSTTKKSEEATKKSDKTETTKKTEDKNTTKKESTTKKKDSKPSTKKEIIDYYNKAVNKVKSSAKSVVRTYDNSTNYKGIVEAGGLSKIGKLLMDTFLKENYDRVEYKGSSEIVANFPAEGQKTSHVNEAAVKDAKCVDKGDYYEITLVANCSDSKPDVNPPRGGGIVGRMFNILVPEDITDATDKAGALLELTGIKYSYMGGTIVAHVDKETGNMTYLYTKLPMVLSMEKARALAITVKSAKIGLQFENKWEINW